MRLNSRMRRNYPGALFGEGGLHGTRSPAAGPACERRAVGRRGKRIAMSKSALGILLLVLGVVCGCTAPTGEKIEENIDLPFIDDPEIIGTWTTVDYVQAVEEFDPENIRWQDELFLKEMTFYANGATFSPIWTWTKGYILNHGDKTACHYCITEIKGAVHLFFEWKSGEYTVRHQAPDYYVRKKAGDPALP
jgi:hypothetical protein